MIHSAFRRLGRLPGAPDWRAQRAELIAALNEVPTKFLIDQEFTTKAGTTFRANLKDSSTLNQGEVDALLARYEWTGEHDESEARELMAQALADSESVYQEWRRLHQEIRRGRVRTWRRFRQRVEKISRLERRWMPGAPAFSEALRKIDERAAAPAPGRAA